MAQFKVVFEFATNRDLTEEEKDAIVSAMYLQINEPVDYDQEDIDVDTFITHQSCEKISDKVLSLGDFVDGERQYTLTDPA